MAVPAGVRLLRKQLLPAPQFFWWPEMRAEYRMRSPAAEILVTKAADVALIDPGGVTVPAGKPGVTGKAAE